MDFSKCHQLPETLAPRIFRVREIQDILGVSTLRALSIAHSFGVVPPTQHIPKLRGTSLIFGFFRTADIMNIQGVRKMEGTRSGFLRTLENTFYVASRFMLPFHDQKTDCNVSGCLRMCVISSFQNIQKH